MTEVILTDDQAELIAKASQGVLLRDAAGNIVARIPPKLSEEEQEIVAEAKRRLASDQPRRPFSEVVEQLKRWEAK